MTVDGNDVLACYQAMREAVVRARSGAGPTLIECMTYRFHPHTSDDDDRTYRSREEVEEAKRNDSIILFGRYLVEQEVLREDQLDEIRAGLKQEVDREVDRAWNAPDSEPASALQHVYAEREAAGHGATARADDEEQLENVGTEVSPKLDDSTGDRR